MFKREIKPLSEGMADSIAKSINKLQYVEEKASRPADRADGDVKPQDVSGEEEVKADASAKKAPARKGDQAQADSMETVKEDNTNDKSDDGEGMDKVQPKALKKKFGDRKDKDIDNDGDTDSSDEYLHKRRKAIGKALAKEEVELDEEPQPKWKVQFGNKHYNVTARNTAEANKKAKVLADKDGNKGVGGKIERIKESTENFSQPITEKMGDDDWVHIARAGSFYNPKKDTIVGYSKSPKDPNRSPKIKAGANSAMRIGDAKKKGFAVKEEVELDEAKNYEIKDGKIHISKANFRKVHKDYKNATKGKERMMALDPKSGATTSFQVVFTEELDEAKTLSQKAMTRALQGMKVKPKGSVSLKKAPWDKKEEVDLDEAKSDYTINHKTFSSAVQHAAEVVKKRGFEVDDDEWDRKVAMGPRKPGKGKTNRYTIGLLKGGKPSRKNLQMQVYYDEGRYELNMYID